MKKRDWSSDDIWKEYVKKSQWKRFKKHCEVNSLLPYNLVCILGTHFVLRYLEWGVRTLFEKGDKKKMSCKEAYEKGLEEVDLGLSIAQANCIVQDVIRFSKRGEEFRKWWNKKHGVTGKKGVVVSNIFTMSAKASKK